MKDIPLYKVNIDDVEMVAISLVDEPAIESDFQYFSKQKQLFSITSEDKRIVFGPVIRVDYPILRLDPNGNPYNLVFSKEVAQKMLSDYLSNGHCSDTNLSHTTFFPQGIEPLSFFIKDSNLGVAPKGYDDVADGSVFASFHISNDDIWNAVQQGTFRGFSLEAYLSVSPIEEFSNLSISDLLTNILTK